MSLREQLENVIADLANMSPALIGSEWHLDRCDEARWLLEELNSESTPRSVSRVSLQVDYTLL